ncbi:hypothetical protein GXW82_02255 [Streptacidiphilus sp. 4-A2]|nr:hypothetical protein [Streptacidiphilus sp. 4-A2]
MPNHFLTALLAVVVLPRTGVVEKHGSRRRGQDYCRISAQRYRQDLVRAADRAIATARRSAAHSPDLPALVTVLDVQRRAHRDFGLRSVPREYAAEVLCERLYLDERWLGLVSDADVEQPLH